MHPPDPPSIVEVEQQRALEILVRPGAGTGGTTGFDCYELVAERGDIHARQQLEGAFHVPFSTGLFASAPRGVLLLTRAMVL